MNLKAFLFVPFLLFRGFFSETTEKEEEEEGGKNCRNEKIGSKYHVSLDTGLHVHGRRTERNARTEDK